MDNKQFCCGVFMEMTMEVTLFVKKEPDNIGEYREDAITTVS
jgi:hypothetical protein